MTALNGRLARRTLGTAVALLWAATVVGAARAAEVPFLTGRVVDDAGVLGGEARGRIEALLTAHEQRTTNQVAVLTVRSLEGETIEGFAEKVFRTWALGRKGKDNGVLVVVATGDRRMRIEVGYGLEGNLTDSTAGSIIRNAMAPRFKAGDYAGGTEAGVQAILGALDGNAAAVPEDAPAAGGGAASPAGGGLSRLEAPDMPWYQRVLLGAFVFGIIGLFTVIGVVTPRSGWFLYAFLIPFWAMFPTVVVGPKGAFALLGTYLVAFPIAKLIVRRQPWYEKAAQELKTKGSATVGGFTITSGGSSGGGGGGGGGGFSGGGGSSGGGGASGGW
jgi:uncharacterized protein